MRRFVLNLAAAAVLTGPQAMAQTAQMQCLSPDQRALFQVQALRSEMMVLATACSDDSQYNAFVTRYQPELAAGEKAIDAWFKQKYGQQARPRPVRRGCPDRRVRCAALRPRTPSCDSPGRVRFRR